ncbi:glycerol dehydrogenase [Pseudodesulfovibrio sp.]|uniref:glycerol dehydrogenase n=1 Tax=unclassified Pseudodesulfovibrio TaxID=2661612 RepID=UPI003B00D432
MVNITLFPGRYIQGLDAIQTLPDECARLGSHAFILASPGSRANLLGRVLAALESRGRAMVQTFGRQCSDEAITELSQLCRKAGCDIVVGMGGGKTLDTAKAVARQGKLPCIMIPTIASTDAPCSSICVVYTEAGEFKRADVLPRNPDVVIVDTRIMAEAPPRFLVSGMGDALATRFEADSCRKGNAPNIAGAPGSMTAYALARLCYDTLLEHGPQALEAARAQSVTPALERIVEANTLLSGLGFESAGLAAAHSIHNGLTALPQTNAYYHGEKVAFGTLASLFLTGRHPDEIDEVYGFCEAVGLPTTLADIGLDGVSDPDLLRVAEKACAPGESMHNEPFDTAPTRVAAMLRAANVRGQERRNRPA